MCKAENGLTAADGFTEGPRSYHADCWSELDIAVNTAVDACRAETYADEYETDVALAIEHGTEAIMWLRGGDTIEAITSIETATRIEARYGGSVWEPVAKLFQCLNDIPT